MHSSTCGATTRSNFPDMDRGPSRREVLPPRPFEIPIDNKRRGKRSLGRLVSYGILPSPPDMSFLGQERRVDVVDIHPDVFDVIITP